MRILLLPVFAALLCAQVDESLRVISAGNGWFRNGQPPKSQSSTTKKAPPQPRLLTRGAPLNKGDEITGNIAAGELVLDCGEKGWVEYSCKPNGPCDFKVCDESKDVNRRPLKALGMTLAYLRREPKEGVTLGVRSGGNPADAVLLQNVQGIHWGPALSRVIEGSYCLRLNPLPPPASPAPQVFLLNWDRETDPEGIGQVRSLLPGLYTLDKGKPGAASACDVDADETPAWVLIAVESQFAQINGQWKEKAADLAKLAGSGVDPSVMATLRHAMLAALADGVTLR